MKERVRDVNGKIVDEFKCSICGLSKSTINKLDDISPDIHIPQLTAGFGDYQIICDNCKESIMDHIYDNYIQMPTNHGLFGINLRTVVNKFIQKNKKTLEDIASDYKAILEVHSIVVADINKFQKENEEKLGLPCLTMKQLKEYVSSYNKGDILTRTDNLKSKISIDESQVPEEILIDIFENSVMVDKIISTGVLFKVEVQIDIELMYEENCSVSFCVFAIEQVNKNNIDNVIDGDIPIGGFTIK